MVLKSDCCSCSKRHVCQHHHYALSWSELSTKQWIRTFTLQIPTPLLSPFLPPPLASWPLEVTEKDLPQWCEEGGDEDAGRWGLRLAEENELEGGPLCIFPPNYTSCPNPRSGSPGARKRLWRWGMGDPPDFWTKPKLLSWQGCHKEAGPLQQFPGMRKENR